MVLPCVVVVISKHANKEPKISAKTFPSYLYLSSFLLHSVTRRSLELALCVGVPGPCGGERGGDGGGRQGRPSRPQAESTQGQ